jgi:ribosomal protein S18 acetylase RimI-like enzyme
VTLFNESFVDHWNYHPWTVEEAAHWEQDPNYQPELELIAVAPDGTYTAFCRCCIEVENNTHHGEQKGWVQTLGTRRDCRRQGLGRAMLLHGLHQLQSAGMELAALGVDAENPNQAFKLYESMGFQKRHASFIYAKSVQA